ncbi:MAG: cytochrome c peroxidase [Bacteroidota bacterium]
MKKNHLIIPTSLVAIICILISSCQPEETLPYRSEKLTLPSTAFQYASPELPQHLKFVVDQQKLDAITNDGATLGRVLFYDKKLSVNNKVSCGSCHHQTSAFADPVDFSVGFEGKKTSRNALAIANTINQPTFFWDSRTKKLEDLVTQPILNHIEMGMEDLGELEEKLASISYYPPLFEKAFGSPEVSKERIASAATQFMNSMISSNSKVDRKMQGGGSLSLAEQRGEWIFFGNGRCYLCHSGPDFRGEPTTFGGFGVLTGSNETWANIGLDETYTDNGIGRTNSDMNGVFKVPSLRNVALTEPYMHDGRFKTLEEVVEHYNSGIEDHPSLDWRLRGTDIAGNEGPVRMEMTEQDKADLIAYLHTLTDHDLISDPKFSNPFEEE